MTQANVLSQLGSPGVSTGFKNRIINGAMVIDQRNAGASVSAVNGSYTLDRYTTTSYAGGAVTGKYTVQQNAGSVTPPVGFSKYLGVTSSAATVVGPGDIYAVTQPIEGLNIYDLNWGTANAKTVTLSFWVRSSLTGTFGGALGNDTGDYNYPYTYSISAANTWEQKSITIAGPTAGAWLTTNGTGIFLRFGLGGGTTWSEPAGSWTTTLAYTADSAVNVVSTSGATWYITGVQLEVGATATNFDVRAYGTELLLCQRYYEKSYAQGTVPGTATETNSIWGSGQVTGGTTGEIGNGLFFKVVKRASATMVFYDTAGNSGKGNRILLGAANYSNQSVFANYVGDASTFVNSSGNSANIQAFHYTASAEL